MDKVCTQIKICEVRSADEIINSNDVSAIAGEK